MKVKVGTSFFFGGFHVKQEDQQPKRQADKGKVMMKKLGQKAKLENKEYVEVEKAVEPVEIDSKPRVFLVSTAGRYSLFSEEELQPRQQLRPAAVSKEPRAAVIEKVDMP